jgi:hypothetical protein
VDLDKVFDDCFEMLLELGKYLMLRRLQSRNSSLRQLQSLSEASPGQDSISTDGLDGIEMKLRLPIWSPGFDLPLKANPEVMIFNHGYDIFATFYVLEIMESALGSIQQEARKLDCFMWNQQLRPNLWSQGNISMVHTFASSFKDRASDSIVDNIVEVLSAESRSHMNKSQMTLRQIAASVIFSTEQDPLLKFTGAWLYWYEVMHGVDTVPVVRVDPSEVDDNTSVVDPQIQLQGHLSLSSVMDFSYLQLSTPFPLFHTPDRLSGEPPAGHQLVWTKEIFEDYSCGTFGSELSTDGRSPFGSYCSLRCQHHVLSSLVFRLCHTSYLYLALFFGAAMYCDL